MRVVTVKNVIGPLPISGVVISDVFIGTVLKMVMDLVYSTSIFK